MKKNFSKQDLRGKSFQGQDLTHANFSHSDIRGANFSNANLVSANFSHSRSGQQLGQSMIFVAGVVCLGILTGLITGYASGLIASLMVIVEFGAYDELIYFHISSWITLLILLVFGILLIRSSWAKTVSMLGAIVSLIVALIGIASATGKGEASVAAIMQTVAIAFLISSVMVSAVIFSAFWMKYGFRKLSLLLSIVLASLIPGILEAATLDRFANASTKAIILSVATTVSIYMLGLGLYISWQVIRGEDRYQAISKLRTYLSSLGGTNFRNSDLQGANFSYANMAMADLRGANITHSCWFEARGIVYSRYGQSYLSNPVVRELVTTKNGYEDIYDQLNLQGLNLEGAQLARCSFIQTNFSDARLQRADFTGAKLAKAQLYGANLCQANLTGAYIQDWAIATNTVLEDIHCDYIFMRLPTNEDPDPARKPDNKNEEFELGDFTDFITPIVKMLNLYQQQHVDPREMVPIFKSLDLYHHENVDPSAAIVTLKQLADEYPEAQLAVTALEGKSSRKFRLQTNVASEVDRSKLSSAYQKIYREVSSLPSLEVQALLASMAEKDKRIKSLEQMVMAASLSDKFYIETNYNLGDTVGGDKIEVGDISESEVAVGRDIDFVSSR